MDNVNYVPYLNLFGVKAKEIPCLTGNGAPTTETAGAVGMFYMNIETGDLYKCTEAADAYTWVKVSGGSGGSVSINAVRVNSSRPGVKITITQDDGDGNSSSTVTFVYDGAKGKDGANGLSVYPFAPGDADLSGVIPIDTVIIPDGRKLQVGDFLITTGGEIYRVTTAYNAQVGGFEAEYFITISGGLPAGGTAGQVLTMGDDGSPVWADMPASAEGASF